MADCQSLRVVFAGTPDFAAVALEALLQSNHSVVGVLTQPDRPAGRGRSVTARPGKILAEQHDVPVQQPQTLKDAEAVEALSKLNCDIMVVAAYGLILPANVLNTPSLGCLNIHASLLPRWRGAAPIQRAMLAGDAETGVCIMKMDEGLDTGDIVSSAAVAIGVNQTGGELHDVLAELGAKQLIATLPGFCSGELAPVPQPDVGVTYAEKFNKAEAALDFSQPATEVHRKIQAFNPWPVAEATLGDVRYRIRRSQLTEIDLPAAAVAGQVIAADENGIRVATGDGAIELLEIQKPGKKNLSAADFVRGTDIVHKVFI